MKFLKIIIQFNDEDELDTILSEMRTTINDEREPIVDENGVTYVEIRTDDELMAESFCLGMVFQDLEENGIENPFFVEVVELETPPIGIIASSDVH